MLSKVLSLDYLSCLQIWNIGLEKVGGGPPKLNEEKGDSHLERETKKQRRHFFVGRTTWKFCSGGEKMRNASGHQCKVKMSGIENKSEREHVWQHVSKKFLKFSRCSRAKQRQRNVQKECADAQSWFFANYTYCCFFTVLRRCLRRLSLHHFIFGLNKLINIIESFAFSPG